MDARESLLGSIEAAGPLEDRSPSLRAPVYVLSDPDWPSAITSAAPDSVCVQRYTDATTYLDALAGNVAVAFLAASIPDSKLKAVAKQTIATSEHAQIVLIATDSAQLLRCEVPHDETITIDDRKDLDATIKRLYIRAYYSTTIQQYYKVGLSIQNCEMRQTADGSEQNERHQNLVKTHELLRSFLEQFRSYLTVEDLRAIKRRDSVLRPLMGDVKEGPDPTSLGLPQSCPDCDLDWTVWHGHRLRHGYEKIGANTWSCTACGQILTDGDPDNYRVG